MNPFKLIVRLFLMAVLLFVAGLFWTAWGQETNRLAMTNGPSPVIGPEFPVGKEGIWLALIPPITFTITWMLGKIPPLPKEILPWIVPVAGILIGAGLEYASKQNWPWWYSAGAGAVATWAYEAIQKATGVGPQSILTPTAKKEGG